MTDTPKAPGAVELRAHLDGLRALMEHPDQSPCDAIRFDQECGSAYLRGDLVPKDDTRALTPAKIRAAALKDALNDQTVFAAMVDAAEEIHETGVSFNVVIGDALRAAIRALITPTQET